MIIHNAEFIAGAGQPGSFPEIELPEIAFAGRSNVGKSSLINSFVHRKNLARISSTPGKTSEINFFNVENKWVLVDMPGFGFTKRGAKKREEWLELNNSYLSSRENLKMVCVLIDSRHDPMDLDLSLIEWLENQQIPYLIVLTKCDKLKPKAVEARKEQLDHFISQCFFAKEVLPYSSVTDLGRNELMGIVRRLAEEK
jgi:GTP-binding protein